ncbi:ESPR domain-containing protein, partial [Paraburkholderia sp. SIMBA_009]
DDRLQPQLVLLTPHGSRAGNGIDGMNRNLHRIVFNRALGLFQAVTELARRDGPGQGGEASAAGSRFVATLRPLGFAVASAFGL